MFKKKCRFCGKIIRKGFNYCPFCGNKTEENINEDYGFLGKNDSIEFPNFGISFLDKMFNSLIKEFERQFIEIDKEIAKEKNKKKDIENGISISISTEPGKSPKIEVSDLSGKKRIKEKNINVTPRKIQEITEEEIKKIAKLPRQEAETKVRRLSNRIIYEINLPGVKNIKNVFINKLENSIEIKAFSKEKVYFKLIPVNLPIINYTLKEEKLILELAEK
ncbi:MAG: hypothetical protein QW117_00375 [Candidatus Pacearchaeota archaeon]